MPSRAALLSHVVVRLLEGIMGIFQCIASSDHSFLHSPFLCSCLASFDPSPLPKGSNSCWRRERGRKGQRWWKRLRTSGLSELPPSPCCSLALLSSALCCILFWAGISSPGVRCPFHKTFFNSIIHFNFSLELLCESLSSFIDPSHCFRDFVLMQPLTRKYEIFNTMSANTQAQFVLLLKYLSIQEQKCVSRWQTVL